MIDPTATRDRIKERLQIMRSCDNAYSNEPNVSGRGFPVGLTMMILAAVVIIAALRGW